MKEKKEKMIFIPSGSVISDIKKGTDLKKAIELHGHDAGEFVLEKAVVQSDIQAIKKTMKGGEPYA